MNIKKFKYKLIPLSLIMFIIAAVSACRDNDHATYKHNEGFKAIMSISNYSGDKSDTRAIVEAAVNNSGQDGWSYRDFTDGDVMGFYANTKKGRVGNMAMLFSAGKDQAGNKTFSFGPLENPDFDPTSIIGSNAFMYFPYTPMMPTEAEPDLAGLELRTKTEPYTDTSYPQGPWRCVDLLVSDYIDASQLNNNGILTGTMVHSFSELIIMRGEGFDHPKLPDGVTGEDPYKIVVKLKDPYTHVLITNTPNPWKCEVKLVNRVGYKPDGYDGDTDFDATLWEAWQGGNYGETNTNPQGFPAWYVLLPTMGDSTSNTRSRVEYIQLYDNDGTLQTIKDLYLSGSQGYVHHQPGNYLDRKWRYPLQISMQELVPTVFPFTIEEWDNGNITNARTRGITQQNLSDFINAYNNFLTSGRQSSSGDRTLTNYGDKIITSSGQSYWHFYILESLDLGYYSGKGYVLPQLQDVIDGRSSPAATPVTITGLTVPFVGKMSGSYDSLLNLTVEKPYLDMPDVTTPSGALVNELTTGGIDNCTLTQGYVRVNGPVGMFAGKMTDGKITNSKVSGIVTGTASSAASGYLVGSPVSGNAYTANNSTVVFSNLNNND